MCPQARLVLLFLSGSIKNWHSGCPSIVDYAYNLGHRLCDIEISDYVKCPDAESGTGEYECLNEIWIEDRDCDCKNDSDEKVQDCAKNTYNSTVTTPPPG